MAMATAAVTAPLPGADPTNAVRQHPLLRATAWSSAIGLAAGLLLGLVTQTQEHDRG